MSLKDKNIMFVLGGPGSGKGTQCQLIAKEYGYFHLSSGDLLRAEVKSGSDQGIKLQEIMKNGLLVPIDIIIGIIKEIAFKNFCFAPVSNLIGLSGHFKS